MSSSRVKVLLVPGCSDGDPLHVPPPGSYTRVDPPTHYLERLGQQWMENRKEARPGVQYTLEALPFGYSLWQRPRPSKPTHFDKYLYGHPGRKPFDSPNRFYPHFEYLMNNDGDSMGCPCKLCSGSAGILPKSTPNSSRTRTSSIASSRKSNSSVSVSRAASSHSQRPASSNSQRPTSSHSRLSASSHGQLPTVLPSLAAHFKGRPKKITPGLDKSNVDSEGTPDVYRNLIEKLRRHQQVDEIIEEPLSPDWRAEQELLPKLLDKIKAQEQWVPRTGDIVLYIRSMTEGIDLIRAEGDSDLQLYDERHDRYLGTPKWEAGMVTETAIGTTVADLVDSVKDKSVSASGLRIEPIPDPNDQDKSLSKQRKYVSLRQTRPFILWRDLLRTIPQEIWHATIKNALTITSTVSLMGKHRFRGTWPNASIYCHGIYVGSELLAVGDTVRLLPNRQSGQSSCTDVMSIKSIRLKWTNLDKASDNDYDEGRPYNSEIWIYGSAYTSNAAYQNKLWITEQNIDAPRVAGDYAADWYPLHPDNKELAIPYSRVLGRLYERDAMTYFVRAEHGNLPNLDVGRHAVVEARAFSRKQDKRISDEPDATWYWGDDRADALNLRTINGQEVARFDPERDVKDLRRQYRHLDAITSGVAESEHRDIRGDKGLRGFMAPALPLRSSALEAMGGSSPSSSTGPSFAGSRKRTHIVDLDEEDTPDDDTEDEDMDLDMDIDLDDEIRQHTRVVEEDRERPNKKAKVKVVID